MNQLKFLLTAFSLITALCIYSQEMPRWVFSQGGGQTSVNNLDLSWTIGQSGLVGTFKTPSVILNAGFQQFDNLMVSVEGVATLSTIKVYPNPFRDQFYLEIHSEDQVESIIQLFDNYGKLLFSRKISEKSFVTKQLIQAQHLSKGLYSVLVTSISKDNKTSINYFKVIKH